VIRYPTLPFVPGAVALGHLLGYALAYPDGAQRAQALTGHGHLGVLVGFGALSALFGLAAAAHARSLDRAVAPRYARLVQLGALGFWLVELVERALHGRLDGLAADAALWSGLALQVGIAALLVALARAAAHLGTAMAPREAAPVAPPTRRRQWTAAGRTAVASSTATPPNRRRGPPLLAA
jgi:hypothetical protein